MCWQTLESMWWGIDEKAVILFSHWLLVMLQKVFLGCVCVCVWGGGAAACVRMCVCAACVRVCGRVFLVCVHRLVSLSKLLWPSLLRLSLKWETPQTVNPDPAAYTGRLRMRNALEGWAVWARRVERRSRVHQYPHISGIIPPRLLRRTCVHEFDSNFWLRPKCRFKGQWKGQCSLGWVWEESSRRRGAAIITRISGTCNCSIMTNE